jgi:predicted small secreted protein
MCGRAPTPPRIRGIRALHTRRSNGGCTEEKPMNNIIYIVGFVVIVLFVLGFLGLR